ncbi:HAMP domain-containing protein [Pseudomonas sp. S37]|uniref:hypothetical protein n=1 Tax=Pseudomonas sp. S37 TaxID=2767449 RepID=UPI00191234BF|nr:hypothetical protein [Pseudomonas sp. S37]MBK4995973.1 HAMP domain-containing protein [Pseudomonas sp. S37]
MAAPLVIALVGLGGWLVSKAFSDDDAELDDEDVDRTLPNAKGRLTKAINKLNKKMESVETLRRGISGASGVIKAIEGVNQQIEHNRAAIMHETVHLEHLTGAASTLERVGVELAEASESVVVVPQVASRRQAPKAVRAISLMMPVKAEEPAASVVKAGFAIDLKTVHDYDKARQKVNKIIRCVEGHLAEVDKAVSALSVAATQQTTGASFALSLEADLMRVLTFYAKPILSKKGNLTKAYK